MVTVQVTTIVPFAASVARSGMRNRGPFHCQVETRSSPRIQGLFHCQRPRIRGPVHCQRCETGPSRQTRFSPAELLSQPARARRLSARLVRYAVGNRLMMTWIICVGKQVRMLEYLVSLVSRPCEPAFRETVLQEGFRRARTSARRVCVGAAKVTRAQCHRVCACVCVHLRACVRQLAHGASVGGRALSQSPSRGCARA